MSLRLRLLLAALALLVFGLVAVGVVSQSSLASFLRSRTNAQLREGVENVRNVAQRHPAGTPIGEGYLGAAAPGVWVQLRDADGTVAVEVQGYAWLAEPLTPKLPAVLPTPTGDGYLGPMAWLTVPAVEDGDVDYRVVIGTTGTGQTIVIGASMLEAQRTLHRQLLVDVFGGLAIVAVAALLGTWLIRLGLRPLVQMERAAEEIAEENLSDRLPGDQARTEVGRLARVLNTMLGRLDAAFAERRASEDRLRRSEDRLRRFVSDASHELRTPVASIRAYAELHLRRGADAGDAAVTMAKIERESKRLTRLVDDLLMLARLDEQREPAQDPVDLGALAADATDAARALEPARTVELRIDGSVEVRGDRDQLRQVLDNLLANVRVHTPPDAPATVEVRAEGSEAVVVVADRGPGLADDQRDQVFERFVRVDPSRTRDSGGAGLGLSIVEAIVGAHAGTVRAEPRDGGGLTVVVRLPLLVDG